jgi:hypothetical protein
MQEAVSVIKHAAYTASATAPGDQAVLWDPGAGKTAYITDVIITSSVDNLILLKIGGTSVLGIELLAKTTWSHPFVKPLHGANAAVILVNNESDADFQVTLLGYERSLG